MPLTLPWGMWQSLAALTLITVISGCTDSGSDDPKAQTANFEVIIRTNQNPQNSPLAVKIDRQKCGNTQALSNFIVNENKTLRNALIWIEGKTLKGWPTEIPPPSQINIKGCQFTPRLTVVPPRGSIRFINNDNILFNIRGHTNVNNPFSRPHPPNLEFVEVQFEKPEIIPYSCDIHPWMKGFVIVAAHPFYAVTDDTGSVKFKNIPLGDYTVKVWHEVLGLYPKPLMVSFHLKDKKEKQIIEWNAN